MTSTDEQDAPPGPATFDAPDADGSGDRRPGREVTDFVARLRDGFPPKVAATDGCMIDTTYALADGDRATDQLYIAPVYNGRGTEPDDGRSMTVRDAEPVIDGPRDPVFIMEGKDGRVLAGCVICEERGSANGSPGTTGTDDGSLVESTDPGSARAALSGHLRQQHNRSPWPGQR